MGNENTKLCETCRHPYESEDHLCRKAMPASDGGPAFPVSADVAGMEGLSGSALGMTMRDYFAAKALAALIAEPVSEAYESMVQYYSRGLDVNGPDAFAHVAYRMADAMLRARESAPAADPVREAAPELLEALEAMDEAFRVDQTRFTAAQADAVRKMDAAIARATGQEG